MSTGNLFTVNKMRIAVGVRIVTLKCFTTRPVHVSKVCDTYNHLGPLLSTSNYLIQNDTTISPFPFDPQKVEASVRLANFSDAMGRRALAYDSTNFTGATKRLITGLLYLGASVLGKDEVEEVRQL